MTDHAKALADALEQVLSQLQDYQRGPIAENAEDALAAYRAAPSLTVGDEPTVPSSIIRLISAYGDARADGVLTGDALGAVIKALRKWGAVPSQPAAQAEPVAWQSRFASEGPSGWRECTKEHHALVQANPDDWQDGYEARALFAGPPSHQPAQGTGELPPLPDTDYKLFYEDDGDEDHGDEGYQEVLDEPGYTAKEMRDYARAVLAQAPATESLTMSQAYDAVKEADIDWHTGWAGDPLEVNRYVRLIRIVERAHGIGAAKEQP